jgi:superfamily II DNA helicase RecQ
VQRSSQRQPARPPKPAAKPGQDLTPGETAVFEELRSLRRHLAAGKPAYTVLSDQALHEIARLRPLTLAELGEIKGMGPVKLERYGNALLAVIEGAVAD